MLAGSVVIKRIHAGKYYVDGGGFGYFILRKRGVWYICLPDNRGIVEALPQDRGFRLLREAQAYARRVLDEIWLP